MLRASDETMVVNTAEYLDLVHIIFDLSHEIVIQYLVAKQRVARFRWPYVLSEKKSVRVHSIQNISLAAKSWRSLL